MFVRTMETEQREYRRQEPTAPKPRVGALSSAVKNGSKKDIASANEHEKKGIVSKDGFFVC